MLAQQALSRAVKTNKENPEFKTILDELLRKQDPVPKKINNAGRGGEHL